MVNVTPFNVLDYLKTPAAISAYLADAVRSGDPLFIRIEDRGARRIHAGDRERAGLLGNAMEKLR
jgi:hypothetical protein